MWPSMNAVSSAKSRSLTVMGGWRLLFLGSTVKLAGLPCAFNVWLDHRIVKEDVGQECRPAILPL